MKNGKIFLAVLLITMSAIFPTAADSIYIICPSYSGVEQLPDISSAWIDYVSSRMPDANVSVLNGNVQAEDVIEALATDTDKSVILILSGHGIDSAFKLADGYMDYLILFETVLKQYQKAAFIIDACSSGSAVSDLIMAVDDLGFEGKALLLASCGADEKSFFIEKENGASSSLISRSLLLFDTVPDSISIHEDVQHPELWTYDGTASKQISLKAPEALSYNSKNKKYI